MESQSLRDVALRSQPDHQRTMISRLGHIEHSQRMQELDNNVATHRIPTSPEVATEMFCSIGLINSSYYADTTLNKIMAPKKAGMVASTLDVEECALRKAALPAPPPHLITRLYLATEVLHSAIHLFTRC